MKKSKKITALLPLLVGIAFVFMSCEEKKPPPKPKEKAYYCFTSEDYKRLLPYTKGQVLKFINQDNKERTFTIYSVDTEKVQLTYSGFTGTINLFSYDKKVITLIDGKTKREFYIGFSRRPIDDNSARQDTYTKYPSMLYGCILHMPFWNVPNGEILIDYGQAKIEMIVNGRIYQGVFVFASGSSIIEEEYYNGNILYRDVNVLYYDEIEGIIGFDDLNGNEWRLIE